MAQQIINTGAYRNDPNADPMWIGGTKINENFTELYNASAVGNSQYVIYASHEGVPLDSNVLTGGGTDATSALNNLLERLASYPTGGTLVLDGAALISAALRVGDYTTILSPNKACGCYLADNSNCEMIINTAVPANQTNYPNIPAQYNESIQIIGGTWNGNCDNQTRFYHNGTPNTLINRWVMGFSFYGVNNLVIRGVTIRDAKTFAYIIAYADNPIVEDYQAIWTVYTVGANQDTTHYWGPITGTNTLRNIYSRNGSDDVLALNYNEASDPNNVPGFIYPDGISAINTLVDGVLAENCQSFLRLANNIPQGCGNVTVRNCMFDLHSETGSNAWAGFIVGNWNRVILENWKCLNPTNSLSNRKKIEFVPTNKQSENYFESITWQGDDSDEPFVQASFDAGTGGAKLVSFNNCTITRASSPNRGAFLKVLNAQANNGYSTIRITNCEMSGYAYLVDNTGPLVNIGSLVTSNLTLNNGSIFNPSTNIAPLQFPEIFTSGNNILSIPCSGWTTNVAGTGVVNALGPSCFDIETGVTTASTVLARANPLGFMTMGPSDNRIINWARPVSATISVGFVNFSANTKARFQVGEAAAKTTVSDLDAAGMGFVVDAGQLKILAHNGTTLTTSASVLAIASNHTKYTFTLISNGLGTISIYSNGIYLGQTTGGPTAAGSPSNTAYNISVANGAGTANLNMFISQAEWAQLS